MMVLLISSIDDLPTRLYHIRSKEAAYTVDYSVKWSTRYCITSWSLVVWNKVVTILSLIICIDFEKRGVSI